MVHDTVGGVRVNYCSWCRHLVSNPTFEPVVEGFTVETVPQLRAAALVAARAVDAGTPVMTGRRAAVVDRVELAPVSGRSRQTRAVERRRSWHTGRTVLTRRAVAVRVGELASIS